MTARDVLQDLRTSSNPAKAAFFPRFFKTGKGDYGEGDMFLGVTVPRIRELVKKHRDLPLKEIEKLLADPIHECRLAGALLLVDQHGRGDDEEKKRVQDFYLSHLSGINNWDIVDSSAPALVGPMIGVTGKSPLLTRLAKSKNLWKQRIAIVATLYAIRHDDFRETFRIAEMFLTHPHDLIHKAAGWMLREAGKRDEAALRIFLDRHASRMPRTMLRYAIERLDERTRHSYMTIPRMKK